MRKYAETKRIILDAPQADLGTCLQLALTSLNDPKSTRSSWGYWSAGDPNFQALVRVNKASISVKAVRKMESADDQR